MRGEDTPRLDATDPSFPNLHSHPGRNGDDPTPLERHLLSVARRATDTVVGDDTEVTRVLCLAHDFGKACADFQTSLESSANDGPEHARLGGLLAYHVLRERAEARDTKASRRTRCAAIAAVARHHGDVPDVGEYVTNNLVDVAKWRTSNGEADDATTIRGAPIDANARNARAVQQALAIDEESPAFARACMAELLPEADPADAWTRFCDRLVTSVNPDRASFEPDASLLGALNEDLMRRVSAFDRSLHGDGALYTETLRLSSALVFADKTHAAGIKDDDERLRAHALDAERVRTHLDELAAGADADGLEAKLNGVRGSLQTLVDGRDNTMSDPIEAFSAADERVATLPLPTGYGKTLTGLLAAARIRERTGGERIIYALPLTSIIDQTADVIGDVVDPLTDAERATLGRALTVHHHLSESLILPASDKGDADGTGTEPTDAEADRATMLAEAWRAGTTLTTFVQFFESLAGPRNAQSMKLPALEDAVVILDEPQALPLRWWPLVERLFSVLTEEYDATILLMTATQPRIVPADDCFPLVDDDALAAVEHRHFDEQPKRVAYAFDRTALTDGRAKDDLLDHDTAAERVVDAACGTTDSVLAVCNTIDSVGTLYAEVTDALGDSYVNVAERYDDALDEESGRLSMDEPNGADAVNAESNDTDDEDTATRAFAASVAADADETTPAVIVLSTRVRARDRTALLTTAEELIDADIPFVLVSTQLIEAGVDVSFDRVFRDLAPLDSVVQVAGRCNRSYERHPDHGRVTVWQLDDPDEDARTRTPPSSAVYVRGTGSGLDLLTRTREALADTGVEADTWHSEDRVTETALDTYQEAVGESMDAVSDDDELLEAYTNANGRRLRSASIIDQTYSFEVYVCRTEADYKEVERLRDAIESYEFGDAASIRKTLADIRVSIPVYRPDSDVAGRLRGLPALVPADRRPSDAIETERVYPPSSNDAYFDVETGFEAAEVSQFL